MKENVIKRIDHLKLYREKQVLGTHSGNQLFNQKLDLAISYFENFLQQLNQTNKEFKFL